MNNFSFTGNLGRDVSTNNVSGTAVANFAVAVKSGFGQHETTIWIDCALWGTRAEGGVIQYLTKGQSVAISGELGTREYKANDGTNKTALTCRVNGLTLIGGKNDSPAPAPQPQPQPQPASPEPSDEIFF